MEEHGGLARAGQDDVFVLGPPEHIFTAIDKFSRNLWNRCGLKLQRSKTLVYAPGNLQVDIPPDLTLAGDMVDGQFKPGLDVYGCPLGSDEWISWHLDTKISELAQSKSRACTVLDNDKQALWVLLSLSFSKKLDYLASLVYPSIFHPKAKVFDSLLHSYLQHTTGLLIPEEDQGLGYECCLNPPVATLSSRSFQSLLSATPRSKGGLGLRPLSVVTDPAFIGSIEMSLPFFTGPDGLLPALETVVGRPDLGGDERWAGLINRGSRTGVEFLSAWQRINSEASECCNFLDEPLEGILGDSAEGLGNGSTDGSSRSDLVKALESLHSEVIHQSLNMHVDQSARPVRMYVQRDKVSQAWLSALPGPLTIIPSREFSEAMAWHLFLPSPACKPHVGVMIKGKPLDPFGEVLMCAQLPFDTWRVRHDRVKFLLHTLAMEAGVIVDSEPYGLFSHLIPSAAQSAGGHLHHKRERQGLIPDLMLSFPSENGNTSAHLAELKILSAGATFYHSKDVS